MIADDRASSDDAWGTRSAAGPRERVRHTHDASPLWLQVRNDLMTRIEQREFSDVFPGEAELVGQYGVSRQTIRHALRELREQRIITAARGQLSRVRGTTRIEQPIGSLYSLFSSVEAAGLEQRSVVRCLDVRTDPAVSERLDLDSSARLVYLERVRYAGGEPLAYDRVWLPTEHAEPLLHVDFTRTALYDELASRCGLELTGGDERIRAVVPNGAERELLQLPEGVAAFAIERLGDADGEAVEWRISLVRGDRFTALAHFDRQAGYQIRLAEPVPSFDPESRMHRPAPYQENDSV